MLTSPRNDLLRRARSLHTRKGRARAGAFLAEGRRAIETIVRSGAEVEMLLAPDGDDPLVALAVAAGVPVTLVEAAVLQTVCDTVNPEGFAALVRSPEVDDVPLPYGVARVLLLDQVRDPGNLGTLLRTCDAADAALIALPGCVHALSPKAVRASAGSVVRTVWRRWSINTTRDWLAERGGELVILDASGESLYDAPLPQPLALLAGSEAHGANPMWDEFGVRRSLPMRAGVESLNVATAAAVALFESVRQQRQ